MSKDVRDMEPKLIGPFNRRQAICSAIAAAYGVPCFFLIKGPSVFVRIIIAIILMIPVIACGWLDMYGMHLEQFILHIWKTQIKSPRKRKCEYQNMYEEIYYDQILPNEEPAKQTKKVKRRKKDGRIQ